MSDTISTTIPTNILPSPRYKRTIQFGTGCPAASNRSTLIELIQSLPSDVKIEAFDRECNNVIHITLSSSEWKSTVDKPLEVYTCRQVLR